MTGWLIYDKEGAKRNTWFINEVIGYVKKRGAVIKLMIAQKLVLSVSDSGFCVIYENQKQEKPDFVLNRTIFPFLSRYFEKNGVDVFNCADVSEICNDKRKTHLYLMNKNIPMMETRFFDRRFFECGSSDEFYPCVVKPANGHGGNGVFIVNNYKELNKIVKSYETDEFLLQKIASEKGCDLRVYIIANKITAAVIRKSENDFRSNFSLGGSVSLYSLSESEEKTVKSVMSHFDLAYAGIDFVFDSGEMKLNEIEDVVGARMLYKTCDIAAHELYVDYILNKIGDKYGRN